METAEWIGTEKEPIEVTVDNILNAIAEGKSIKIEYAIIKGNLSIGKIKDRLERNENNRFIICGNISIQSSEIQGHVNFSHAKLGETIDFSEVQFREKTSFKNAKFGKVISFISAQFEERTDFRYVQFGIGTSFSYAKFKKEIYFSCSKFGEVTDFSSAIFAKNTVFEKAQFGEDTNFERVQFEGNTVFSNSGFGTYVNFGGVKFGKSISFSRAKFGEKINFSGAQFEGYTDFSHAQFEGETDFNRAKFDGKHTGFNDVKFGEHTVFERAKFGEDIVFSAAQFGKSTFFSGSQFKFPAIFAGVKYWSDSVRITWARWFWKDGIWGKILKRFLFLPENCPEGKPQKPAQFHLDSQNIDEVFNPHFKRYVADQQYIRSFKENHPVIYQLWRKTSNCGRSLSLWAGWSLAIAVVFAFIYRWFGNESIAFNVDKLNDVPTDFWDYLYYSVVTFTTLGFGDIVPLTKLARLAVGIEVVMGYIMLGGLISIFANKLARRS